MENTIQQQQAYDLIEKTNTSFFLTGRAGTGKTTFLRRVQKEIDKNFIWPRDKNRGQQGEDIYDDACRYHYY